MQAAVATYQPNNYNLIGAFVQGLKPEPEYTVEEWAEKNRKLDSKGSAEPGPYNTKRTPYLRAIMWDLSPRSGVMTIVVKKAAQLGFTEIGFNLIGFHMDAVPCPMMYVMPTLDTMERNVKIRINPMIMNTPRLLEKIGGRRSKEGGNNLQQKDFPGGVLILSGANSAASLRSVAVRVAVLDEVDEYEGDVGDQGDPISLVEKRTSTYGSRKKIYMLSTPTVEGRSRIDNEYNKTDQRKYFVPCPHCHTKQTLEFERLKWEKGSYETDKVYYECEHCQEAIYERHKTYMLANGEWIATAPQNKKPDVHGYHINGLYSPDGWKSWASICKEYDEAMDENDENKLKTFYNTILGETYKTKSEAPQWELLYERAQAYGVEPNKPMASVAFITAGVDIQADRIEVDIKGWMKGRSSQQIDYRVLTGDVLQKEVWEKLADVLNETWEREDGAVLPIRIMAIDTGYKIEKVEDFARKHGLDRVIPIKGMDKLQMPFSAPKVQRKTKGGKNIGRLKVWHVGVSYLKSQLYSWLRLTVDPETGEVPQGYCYFTKRDSQYFRGLTAEVLQPVRSKKNYISYVWVKKYERNEPLDTAVYATAGAYILGFDRWKDDRWESEVKAAFNNVPRAKENKSPVQKVKKKKNRGSGYWE